MFRIHQIPSCFDLQKICIIAEGKCSPRTELDSRCRKRCTRDGDCVSRKKKIRKCLCDGACGMSCIRVGK